MAPLVKPGPQNVHSLALDASVYVDEGHSSHVSGPVAATSSLTFPKEHSIQVDSSTAPSTDENFPAVQLEHAPIETSANFPIEQLSVQLRDPDASEEYFPSSQAAHHVVVDGENVPAPHSMQLSVAAPRE